MGKDTDIYNEILGRVTEEAENSTYFNTTTRKEILQQRLANLTKAQMNLVRLYYFEHKTYKELADMFKVSKDTIKRRLRVLHKKLKATTKISRSRK